MFPTSVHVGPQSLAHTTCVRCRASLRRRETSTSGRSAPLQALTSNDVRGVRRWGLRSGERSAETTSVVEGGDAQQVVPKHGRAMLLDGKLVEVPEKYEGLSKSEISRRLRISRRNKGNQPWNKGRKHPESTKQLIRERTKEAMRRESVVEKCRIHYDSRPSLTPERKAQISASMKATIRARKLKQKVENILTPNQDAAMKKKAKEKKAAERKNARQVVKKKKPLKPKKPPRSPNDPKSDEHRAKIAEAIRRKWQDPEYQMKQRIGIQNAKGRLAGMPRKPRAPRKASREAVEREKKYLEVVKHIKLLQTGIRDLENQKDLLSSDGESVEEIDDMLEETTETLSKILQQIKSIHEELGPKLGVDISFDVRKIERSVPTMQEK